MAKTVYFDPTVTINGVRACMKAMEASEVVTPEERAEVLSLCDQAIAAIDRQDYEAAIDLVQRYTGIVTAANDRLGPAPKPPGV